MIKDDDRFLQSIAGGGTEGYGEGERRTEESGHTYGRGKKMESFRIGVVCYMYTYIYIYY